MPQLSESMEEGTILKWLVEEGGEVKKGEPLVEIETDKANTTYDAETDGTLVEIIAKEGDTLAVGQPIARIGDADDAGDADADDSDADDSDADGDGDGDGDESAPSAGEGEPPAADAADHGDVAPTPVAQRIAEEEGVDLEAVDGTGRGGRITKEDVEAAQKRGGAKGEVEITEPTRLQQTVSRRMAESKATAPDYSLTVDVDMTLAVQLHERLGDAEPRPSFNDMVIKATANALREHPRVNGAYRDGKFEQYSRVNVGIAVSARDALVVPTIFDADTKSLGQISRDAFDLAEKVRDGKVTPPELAGGTFTISNLGMYGIDEFTAVINPPQAAILTVGALKKRPAVDENGRVVARDQLRLTLICDQRILYGADAAEFLARVRELLEEPLQLAL
jgi:pyruvate dehydrogenase E2 component (dihydrolipoamide acetyltransferase)